MIEIDGSLGEGGGQILRTSVALASLLKKPIRVYNIRANRPKPGLKLQHATGIRAAAKLCNAEITGVKINSREIIYKPSELVSKDFKINISTAGSISLILQVLLPIMAFSPSKINLVITGGTDVNWSPPINYIQNVIKLILKKMNYNFEIRIIRRGHYPKGGGEIVTNIEPVHYFRALNVSDYKEIKLIQGISHCVKLPKHVALRQMNSANKILRNNGYPEAKIKLEWYQKDKDPHLGPGSGIVLWCMPDNDIPIGGDALGERGKRAELVGEEAANRLIYELKRKALFDIHAGNMIIPYIALANGRSKIKVGKLTSHIQTNIEITQNLLGTKFKVKKSKEDLVEISVDGIGYKNKNN